MKKIINSKLYNTETATEIGCWDNNLGSRDFNYCCEYLYIKKTGEFFIYGYGGPMSKYAEPAECGGWSGGGEIHPISENEAMLWAEKKLSADEYLKLWSAEE